MKTKDRILLTSLTLFNEEGEPNVTTVDIAAELDISPGNLYYHFKGKEAIIETLYLAMERELLDILRAPIQDSINVEDIWLYLYVVFEQIHKYRFFYRNIADILGRYPKLRKRFARLLDQKRTTASASLAMLVESDIIDAESVDAAAIVQLSDNITLLLTYWLNYNDIDQRADNNPVLSIHRGVFQVMSMVAPLLRAEYHDFYQQCHALFDALSAELE